MTQKIHKKRFSILQVFITFLKLGLTSFGGPIAHIGFFRNEFVTKKKWLDEHAYADLVALCQFLPGPASSQVGMAIGLSRAGVLGSIAAWLGFTLPSAILLVLFGLWFSSSSGFSNSGLLHGLKLVAVPIVAQAILGMGKNLCPDKERFSIAILAAITVSIFPSALGQVAVIVAGGILGVFFLKKGEALPHASIQVNFGRISAAIALSLFFGLLLGLPWIAGKMDYSTLRIIDGFYRAGSLVFGGGHVVLPLLQSVVVTPGWVSKNAFMAGYGAAQAVPGPLFTFAAYLGSVLKAPLSGWAGAFTCLVSVFLPSFLLIIGVLPFWEKLRRHQSMRYIMQGINAAVVGLLLSAFYNPVWTSAIFNPVDFSIAAAGFLLLVYWKFPSWLVVIMSALVGGMISLI